MNKESTDNSGKYDFAFRIAKNLPERNNVVSTTIIRLN